MKLPSLVQRILGRSAEASGKSRPNIEPHVAKPVPANFMVVLRESPGISLAELSFQPLEYELQAALSPNDSQPEEDLAWYHFLGDIHLRFVYYDKDCVVPITRANFEAHELSVEQALDIAVDNIRTQYGAPRYRQWSQGIQIVQGESSDIDSSYLFDDLFWEELDGQYPQGLVVAVPKRGGLLFASAANKPAVELLTQNVTYLHSTSAEMRISGALYARNQGRWSMLQEAQDG